MKTKTIPFDLETAKKIQAGEIEGRIIFCDKSGCYVARVICFDRKLSSEPIVALYATSDEVLELILICNEMGVCPEGEGKLLIELPEKEPKHEFKPFDKVLVRGHFNKNYKDSCWYPALFERIIESSFDEDKGTIYYKVLTNVELWRECIPYEGNQELVGTTKTPKED